MRHDRSGSMPSRPRAAAFTLIELLVVIAIVAILWVLLMPPLRRPQEKWRQAQCGDNLKRLGASMLRYAVDHDEHLPPAAGWARRIAAIWGERDVFTCPGDDGKRSRWRPGPYAFSLECAKADVRTLRAPEETPLLWDATLDGDPALRHCGGLQVGFADGHAKWHKQAPPGLGLGALGPPPDR